MVVKVFKAKFARETNFHNKQSRAESQCLIHRLAKDLVYPDFNLFIITSLLTKTVS